jgi:hypothetical protein
MGRDFFKPLHEEPDNFWELLSEMRGLPPGSRFLLAGEQVDVWFDASLLKV